MHILTISPIIVLVVPNIDDEYNHCGAPGPSGCIPSPRTGAAFFYKNTIKFVSGSFWFSPDIPMEVTYLPDDAQYYTIELPDSLLELVAKDGIWNVKRNAVTNNSN